MNSVVLERDPASRKANCMTTSPGRAQRTCVGAIASQDAPTKRVRFGIHVIVSSVGATSIEKWHDMYVEHAPAVHAFIARRTRPALAEDMTAEVFVRAFRAWSTYDERGVPVRAWLLRIAYNLIVDESRRATPASAADNDAMEAVLPALPSAEHEALLRSDSHALLRAVMLLPEAARSAVELRYIQELSVEETAAVLGVSHDVVRARAHRGLKALRGHVMNGEARSA